MKEASKKVATDGYLEELEKLKLSIIVATLRTRTIRA